jgi:hypothetical protein
LVEEMEQWVIEKRKVKEMMEEIMHPEVKDSYFELTKELIRAIAHEVGYVLKNFFSESNRDTMYIGEFLRTILDGWKLGKWTLEEWEMYTVWLKKETLKDLSSVSRTYSCRVTIDEFFEKRKIKMSGQAISRMNEIKWKVNAQCMCGTMGHRKARDLMLLEMGSWDLMMIRYESGAVLDRFLIYESV